MINFYKLVNKIIKNKVYKGDLVFPHNVNPFLVSKRKGSYIFDIKRIVFFIRKILYFIYLLKWNNGSILFIGLNSKKASGGSNLKSQINNLIRNKIAVHPNLVFIENFNEGSLTNVSGVSSLKAKFNGKWPNLVISLSKLSKNNIQEFMKYGIPLSCFINDEKLINYIDYPLIGDANSLQSVIFYLDLISFTLNKD